MIETSAMEKLWLVTVLVNLFFYKYFLYGVYSDSRHVVTKIGLAPNIHATCTSAEISNKVIVVSVPYSMSEQPYLECDD